MGDYGQEGAGTIQSQAVAWLFRLDSQEASENDLAGFEQWLSEHPLHAYYFNSVAKAWDSAAQLSPLSQYYPHSLNSAATASKSEKKPWSMFSSVQIAVSGFAVAAVVMLAVFIRPMLPETHEKMLFQTAVGELKTFDLPDGSRVTLNTNSRVTIDYSRTLRSLVLERGEGNFKVAKNKQRPFLVKAGQGAVIAVGTEFVVRYTSPAVSVYVSEGIVKVLASQGDVDSAVQEEALLDKPGRLSVVRAGQKTEFQNEVGLAGNVSDGERERFASWLTGSLVFNGEQLDVAIQELSRYTNKKILLSDESLGSLRVGGRYQTDNLEGLAQSMGKMLNLNVSYPDENTIIFSR